MSDKGKRLLGIAVAVAALGVFTGVLVSGAGAASSWSCEVTGEHGGKHNFTVQANDQAGALDACKNAWVASATFKVTPNTTTTTTTSTTTTTTPPGPGYPSLSPPFKFDGDLDSGCQLVGGEGGWSKDESGSDHPGTASVERTTVAEGNCALRASVPAASGGDHTGRSELQSATISTPASVIFEALVYLPSEANNGPHDGSIMQTKQNSNPCFNGAVGLNRDGDGLFVSTRASCGVSTVKRSLGPVPENHWVAVKVAETFSNSGSIRAWLDPDGTGPAGYVEKIPLTSADTLSGDGLKMRAGIYTDRVGHEQHDFVDGFHLLVN